MNVKDFYFDLPQELIAQDPLEDRASSRLLVLDRETGEVTHRKFRDILGYLNPGDCLVINDTKVIPARLIGSRDQCEDRGAASETERERYLGDPCKAWKKGEAGNRDLLWGRTFKGNGHRRSGGRKPSDPVFLRWNF